MKKLFILGAILFLSACAPSSQTDQCLRTELFSSCLKNVPKGPSSIHNSNDWDEVVVACDNVSYYQSMRKTTQITKECLSS